jgi:hypothetical protein
VSPPGSKEGIKREQGEISQMNKKIIYFFLGLTIATLTTSCLIQGVRGMSHIDGFCPTYYEYWHWGFGNPWFVECHHTADEPPTLDDTEVGLSVYVNYAYWDEYSGLPYFEWGDWFYEVESGCDSGYNNEIYSPFSCTACTDGIYYCYFEDNTTPEFQIPPQANYHCLCAYNEYSGSIHAISAESAICGHFHPVNDYATDWWLEAYTQVPEGQYGNGWSFLTASAC